MKKIKIGISSCLLGIKVRYDGGHKLDGFLKDTLGASVDYVPVCPEVECGLLVPRESMHLQGTPENPRLVTTENRFDRTDLLVDWAQKRVVEMEAENLSGFIFKSKSPSCGIELVKIYDDNGMVSTAGIGIFARIFMQRFPMLPVEDERRLQETMTREIFIKRIFALTR